jgi:hypothetical protein
MVRKLMILIAALALCGLLNDDSFAAWPSSGLIFGCNCPPPPGGGGIHTLPLGLP